MAKKIDYAALYTLRKDGYYQKKLPSGKYIYDKDPERLYQKEQAALAPKEATFAEIVERWQVEHVEKLANRTQLSYKHHIEEIIAEHEGAAFSEVGAPEINRVMLRMKAQGLAFKTVSTRRSIYKQVFDYAITNGLTLYNPVLSVHTPRDLPRSTREAPEDDVIKLIKENASTAHFGLFPLFLICTGFRKNEALAVQWKDIDFKEKTISCTKSLEQIGTRATTKAPKTKAGYRTVPLLDDLKKALKKPRGAKETDYVFGGEEPISAARYTQEWLLWCRDVGLVERREQRRGRHKDGSIRTTMVELPKITAHQLRHGYATILYEAGVDELAAKELLGHADIQTTHEIYTHIRQGKRKDTAKAINAKLKSIG